MRFFFFFLISNKEYIKKRSTPKYTGSIQWEHTKMPPENKERQQKTAPLNKTLFDPQNLQSKKGQGP